MLRFLQSVWAAVFLGMASYLGVTTLLVSSAIESALSPPPVQQIDEEIDGPPEGPSWIFNDPLADEIISELESEKAALAARQSELNDLEQRLAAEKQEILRNREEIKRMQRELDQTVQNVAKDESMNLKRLAKVYAAMSPKGAGLILKEMSDEQVFRIMVFMKDDQIASILENMAKEGPLEAVRASLLADRLRLLHIDDD